MGRELQEKFCGFLAEGLEGDFGGPETQVPVVSQDGFGFFDDFCGPLEIFLIAINHGRAGVGGGDG